MSCHVSCGLGCGLGLAWASQGAQAGGNSRRARAELAPYFMHNCWCESRLSVVDLSRPCLSLVTPLEIGTCRAVFCCTLVPQPRWAEFGWKWLVLAAGVSWHCGEDLF